MAGRKSTSGSDYIVKIRDSVLIFTCVSCLLGCDGGESQDEFNDSTMETEGLAEETSLLSFQNTAWSYCGVDASGDGSIRYAIGFFGDALLQSASIYATFDCSGSEIERIDLFNGSITNDLAEGPVVEIDARENSFRGYALIKVENEVLFVARGNTTEEIFAETPEARYTALSFNLEEQYMRITPVE